MYNELSNYEILNGVPLAVVLRDKGKEQIKLCPFCRDIHSHHVEHSDSPAILIVY